MKQSYLVIGTDRVTGRQQSIVILQALCAVGMGEIPNIECEQIVIQKAV